MELSRDSGVIMIFNVKMVALEPKFSPRGIVFHCGDYRSASLGSCFTVHVCFLSVRSWSHVGSGLWSVGDCIGGGVVGCKVPLL